MSSEVFMINHTDSLYLVDQLESPQHVGSRQQAPTMENPRGADGLTEGLQGLGAGAVSKLIGGITMYCFMIKRSTQNI